MVWSAYKSRLARALVSTAMLAMVTLAGVTARADWSGTIVGARPILPARFVPQSFARATAMSAADVPTMPPPQMPDGESPIAWIAPLVDRRLSAAEREAGIAPELMDAILRIEPIYDPTRLEGPQAPVKMRIAAGTAAMDNVFADRWRRADPDPNVSRRVRYIAMAWQPRDESSCGAFLKSRARAGYEEPALTGLTRLDCDVLRRADSAGDEASAAPSPIVAGWIGVPTFAAPMPGSRLSSEAFWAARRADIARVAAELRLRQIWHGGMQGVRRQDFAKR